MAKDVFVTFDLKESNLYDDFYEKAAKGGFKKYIMGKYMTNGKDTTLPNTTLHGRFDGKDDNEIMELARKKISNVFKELKVKGKSLIAVSETAGTNDF